ncbi:hypothetical protein IJ579_08920 [bacterium]|nr:hypothetical protein [bacterium]
MQIAQINSKQNPTFKTGFYNATREFDSSVMLSRALIDLCGCDIPWVVMANNNTERKEKSRKLFSGFAVAWLTPFVTLPLSNRFAMKYIGKLTKSFWSNNHKAIHISNEFLKDTKSMMSELQRMANKTDKNPLEAIYGKFNPKKKYQQKLNIEELLKSVNGDEEKLRQKLISSKNAVFFSDCVFTFTAIGAFPFFNNEITKKYSGQSGFSAEMSMADKEIVEKRAKNYERGKSKRFLAYMGILTGTTLAMSLGAFASLYSKNGSKFVQNLRNGSKLFDYNRGIYMSRLPLFIGSAVTCIGSVLAARNNTERKDVALRFGIPLTIFYGGDLLLSSLFTNLSDRLFGTKLRKEDGSNKSAINKIFPKIKSIKQVMEEVERGKISKTNKRVSAGIFWTNMLILMVSMGYAVPTAINKMIKKDVEKDILASKGNTLSMPHTILVKSTRMEDFVNRLK